MHTEGDLFAECGQSAMSIQSYPVKIEESRIEWHCYCSGHFFNFFSFNTFRLKDNVLTKPVHQGWQHSQYQAVIIVVALKASNEDSSLFKKTS